MDEQEGRGNVNDNRTMTDKNPNANILHVLQKRRILASLCRDRSTSNPIRSEKKEETFPACSYSAEIDRAEGARRFSGLAGLSSLPGVGVSGSS